MNVNGEAWAVDVAPGETLLEVLREKVGVKSPKIGCERGDCGSCTVLYDGKSVRACLVLAVEAEGHEITTLEGISHDGLTVLQEKMVELSSFQCGFCAPGIVLSVHELLQERPDPSADEVKEAISGNLCRCTGYDPIVDAVLEAARIGPGDRG
ncbi:MAG: (2Fe-2S)-binding protein [Actinobacteria bacterium]|nr:(2Fe-2S)-binding protein [Actinomycetota bacterium]